MPRDRGQELELSMRYSTYDLAKRCSLSKRILESANAFIVASSVGIAERARVIDASASMRSDSKASHSVHVGNVEWLKCR